MGRNFKILISAFALGALYGIYYFGIPAVVNLPERVDLIQQTIFNETGCKTVIKNPKMKMGILPSVKIKAENFSIVNDDNSEALSVLNPNIKINLLPLSIKKFNAQAITANLIYDKDEKFKLGQYELTPPKTKFDIKYDKIIINKYNINLEDKISSNKVKINGTDLTAVNNELDINDLKISGNNINILTTGKIKKLNRKLPDLDLKIAVTDTKAENILPLLPPSPDLSPDINLLELKKAGFWGNASAALEIKGKADYPDVYGKVLVTDAYMVQPIANAEKAVIKLLFKGDKMDLDVKVPTSKSEAVFVKGPVNLDKERTAELFITSTKNVDLKTAQIVLNPLHEILHFDIGPVPIMDIKGKGGIDLHVVGTRKNPHGWGQFWFNNASVSFNDINNMTLTNGSGTLDFDDQNTLFQTKTGNLYGHPVKVKGTCTLAGDLNFDVETNNQDIENLLKIVKTSPMLVDIQKMLSPVQTASGPSNFLLNLTGQVKDINDVVFNKNIFAKGKIELLSNSIKLKDMPAQKITGSINFDNLNADFNLASHWHNSIIDIKGKIKDNICNANVKSPRFNTGDAIQALNIKTPYLKDLSTIYTSFDAKYNGKIDSIDLNKINLKGKIFSNKGAQSAIILDNATFEFSNSNLKLPVLKGTFNDSPFNMNLYASKMFAKEQLLNGYFKINSVDLNILNDEAVRLFMPAETAKQLKDFEVLNGKVNLSARMKNNHLSAFSNLDNINILYKPKNIKLAINNGNILLRNNQLNINKLTAKLGDMPLFIDGKIFNIKKNPELNLYVNAKPTQGFFDQFYNNKTLYPIKLKGDANLTSKILGTLNNLNTKSTLKISEDSSLYYMGATIGDNENPVRIFIDSTSYPNLIKINNLQYDKIIESQNNKPYVNTQLTASGAIRLLDNNNAGFNNFRIKTHTPTDAKIFNIIFRKPFMKQGVFTSDLILNGTSTAPRIKGRLDITSIDIPFFESTIKDVNLDFKNDKIFISSKGTVLTNDILINAVMKNSLEPPYVFENIDLKLADLNINKITDSIRDFEAESTRTPSSGFNNSQNFDTSTVIINKADIEADKISVRNINADNFKAALSLNKDSILNVNSFKFDIAEGSVLGSLQHNLNTYKTDLDIKLNNANALIMSEALFDLKGQVYGSVDGGFILSCNGQSHNRCFQTLDGSGTFKIADGRMPKLGSLEYLLKAGNLIKGGFTGLSINSIIDLITPLKTGSFESISGEMNISNGVADKIEIYSNGNDLNMYMTGSYNLVTSIADMKIYGSLSKNITTVFGKIKNASLNTLFNTIPGINSSNEKLPEDINKIPDINNVTDIYRIFAVDINGDINGENYVRSFKWVK